MPTTTTERCDFELSEVEAAVGPQAFDRGRAYARRGRVLELDWDPDGQTLTGAVVGQGALYDTQALFVDGGDGALEFEDGECSCPVGYNCKHVAAIVIAGADSGTTERRSRPASHVAARAEPPPWEQPLRALIGAPAPHAVGNPLAIELSLRTSGLAGGGAPRLMARLKRPGARGGWVNGSLTWSGLDSPYGHGGEHRPDHLALVRELHAVQRARQGRAGYYYHYGADKTLDLSDCSAQLWSLLDEAARVALPLIHAGKELGELAPYRCGGVAIDVTRRVDAHSLARPLLRIDGDDADLYEPVLFLGADGHGVVCADKDAGPDFSGRRLLLVRLARPSPPALQRMVLQGSPLAIPAGDLERFAAEFCPGLRRVATVVSSDGSFDPPAVSDPSLILRARYGEGHAVELGWEWVYEVGPSTRRVRLADDAGGLGFRDLDAERALLADTGFAETGLERFGVLDGSGRPTGGPAVTLTGLESLRFTTEQLPRLRELPGVTVDVEGEAPDYRDVGDSLEIGVSTADIAGERDWFDLGVTIRVEGRELPFAEVFAALASGESHLLLDDGAHFSLLEPRLQALRELIEEARALADSPSAPLRISRYQAGLWAELAALGVVTEQAQAWQRQVGALLELDAIAEYEPPATLTAELRPYQRDGFALARVALGPGARRDPRRRHGARQDAAGARADLPRARAQPRCADRSSWSRRRASCPAG